MLISASNISSGGKKESSTGAYVTLIITSVLFTRIDLLKKTSHDTKRSQRYWNHVNISAQEFPIFNIAAVLQLSFLKKNKE